MRIEGNVLNAGTNEPVTDVRVRIRVAGLDFTTHSGPAGAFNWKEDWPNDGEFVEVTVREAGFLPWRRSWRPQPEEMPFVIRLQPDEEPTTTVVFLVRAADTRPIPGVEVRLEGTTGLITSALSDMRGEAHITMPTAAANESTSYTANKPGLADASGMLKVSHPDPIEIVMKPGVAPPENRFQAVRLHPDYPSLCADKPSALGRHLQNILFVVAGTLVFMLGDYLGILVDQLSPLASSEVQAQPQSSDSPQANPTPGQARVLSRQARALSPEAVRRIRTSRKWLNIGRQQLPQLFDRGPHLLDRSPQSPPDDGPSPDLNTPEPQTFGDAVRILGFVGIFGTLLAAIGISILIFGLVSFGRFAIAPFRTSPGLIIAKRTEVSGAVGDWLRIVTYFITVEFEDGMRREFKAKDSIRSLVAEQDLGLAFSKGPFLLGFYRVEV